MKRIGITHRVDNFGEYSERRDSIDQRWYSLLLQMEMFPVPLPNIEPRIATKFLHDLDLDGFILTGGNSLCSLDIDAKNIAPERDLFENFLIDFALADKLPIFGVCRGMQLINKYFKGKLVLIEGHVSKHHPINQIMEKPTLPSIVNSFHSWAIPSDGLGNGLKPISSDLDGNIEAFIHTNNMIAGIMWHPERDEKFDPLNIAFIKEILS